MYIIEKLIRLYFKFKNKGDKPYNPQNEVSEELEDVLTCNHNFMPIDSTGNILACSKCGYVVAKDSVSKKIKHK